MQMSVVIINVALLNSAAQNSDYEKLHAILYFLIILSCTVWSIFFKPFNERVVNHYYFLFLVYLTTLSLLAILSLFFLSNLIYNVLVIGSLMAIFGLGASYHILIIKKVNFFLLTENYDEVTRAGLRPKML